MQVTVDACPSVIAASRIQENPQLSPDGSNID